MVGGDEREVQAGNSLHITVIDSMERQHEGFDQKSRKSKKDKPP